MEKKTARWSRVIWIVFLLGLFLRIIYFRDATFGYDQARDAFEALDIWTGDHIKLLGPRTDFPGLYHGVFYWYLISPVYFLTHGNVWVIRLFLILLNTIGIFLIFKLTNLLFKNEGVSLIASFFYAISFESTQYARWLSNPSLAIITTLISFWSLAKVLQGESKFFPLMFLFWGLSFQLEFFMVYQIVVFILIWIAVKGGKLPKINVKTGLLSLVVIIFGFGPFLLSEIKFGFRGSKALISFFATQHLFGQQFTPLLFRYLDSFVSIFYLNLWGINLFLAGLLGMMTVWFAIHLVQKRCQERKSLIFLLIWILSPLFLHLFTGTNGIFVNLGAGIGVIILTSWLLYLLFQKQPVFLLLVILVILVGNINLILTQNKKGEVLFSVQKKMILTDELRLIDWIYQQAGGRQFHLNTITNPLFINTTWDYLFNWYGKKKYGYMPIWWGEPQVNVFGSKVIFSPKIETNLHFLIIEPGPGIPREYTRAIENLEDTRSKLIESKRFGNFTVEERQVTNPRVFNSQDVFYLIKHTSPSL